MLLCGCGGHGSGNERMEATKRYAQTHLLVGLARLLDLLFTPLEYKNFDTMKKILEKKSTVNMFVIGVKNERMKKSKSRKGEQIMSK